MGLGHYILNFKCKFEFQNEIIDFCSILQSPC